MDYRIFLWIGIGLIGVYVVLRIMGMMAIKKLIKAEMDHVLHNDRHKVKGRYE